MEFVVAGAACEVVYDAVCSRLFRGREGQTLSFQIFRVRFRSRFGPVGLCLLEKCELCLRRVYVVLFPATPFRGRDVEDI